MMLGAFILLLPLAANAQGEASNQPVRFRASAMAGAVAAYDFRFRGLGLGPGVIAEAGVTLRDRFGLTGQFSGGTIGITTAVLFGLGAAWDASDLFSVGAGAALCALGGEASPGARILFIPLKVSLHPWSRPYASGGRQGLTIELQLFPGVTLATDRIRDPPPAPSSLGPPFALGGAIGFGYTWR